jgi:DNA polymerase-3 subunit gamma/tau
VEAFSGEGRDLYRVLLDVERYLREVMLRKIEGTSTEATLGADLAAESLMRMLDALQDSESALQKGLSEKVNFEVALLRAVEAGRTRALDQLVRELKGLEESPAGEAGKKKA